MKPIFSHFVAKSLLGLSLLAAPVFSFACGPTIDALGTGLATQTSITVYCDGLTIPSDVNSYSIAYRVSGSAYWYYTPWTAAAPLYVFSGPYANMNARSRAVTGLQNGTAYDFMVVAMNTNNGAYYDSDIVYGSTLSGTYTTCYKPSDVFGENNGEAVKISYQVDGGVNLGTRIQFGPNNNPTSWSSANYMDYAAAQTPYANAPNLYIPYGSYFRVGVKCSATGAYTWSNVFQANGGWQAPKEATKSVLATASSISSVYPNPSNGAFRLTLKGELETPTELNVLDINGKTVLTQTVDRTETEAIVDMSGKTAGVYFLKFNGETKKIVLR